MNTKLNQVSAPSDRAIRTSQVEGFSAELEKSIENLQTSVDKIEMRLASVLRSEPDCSKTGEAPEEILVPLADRIRSFKKRVENARIRLDGITERIEA